MSAASTVPQVAAPHVAAANGYILDVLDDRIASCKWVKLACERQARDLQSAKDEAWPYYFSETAAERVCKFVELSPHVKGKRFAGRPIHLEPWQCFILTTTFGWINRNTGLRRFRRAYSEIAKGNGKSALTSAVANYMAFADGEPGAEVYSAATTRDQAKVIWSVSHSMLRAMPEFCERAGVDPAAHSINQLGTNSFFRPLSSDANSAEGILPYFTCVDELHAHPTRELYDNLDTANGKRDGSMLWAITTAGSNQSGVCYEVRSYVTQVLSGALKDETVFGVIYTIDDKDDWSSGPDVWRKANPNWGVSVNPEEIGAKVQRAMHLASAQPTTKTKHLNVWVNADHAWMDMVKFRRCADPSLDIESFVGEPCVIGLDLASKIDLLAEMRLFWKDLGEGERKRRHYFLFGHYWLPEARIEARENSQYAGWVTEGRIETCPGETNDFDAVEEAIRADGRRFDVREVATDPWNATEVCNHLGSEGVTMVEVAQVTKELSGPMKELEAAVYDGRLHYDGDPVLEWAASNVVAHMDKNGNLFPTKPAAKKKIDPVSALLNAMNRVMVVASEGGGGGVASYGPCARCGAFCAGQLVGGGLQFDCGAHS